ncbi:hypothetical protein SBADM41S_01547 [Streptomyces badius]
MADIDIPAHLIDLESAAWAEQQQGALTYAAADAVQAAYREHAAATGVSRLELEMAVKQAVQPAAGHRAEDRGRQSPARVTRAVVPGGPVGDVTGGQASAESCGGDVGTVSLGDESGP